MEPGQAKLCVGQLVIHVPVEKMILPAVWPVGLERGKVEIGDPVRRRWLSRGEMAPVASQMDWNGGGVRKAWPQMAAWAVVGETG